MKTLLFITFLVVMPIYNTNAAPLDLKSNTAYKSAPQIKGFQYISGNTQTGEIIYFGEIPGTDFEAELHANFHEGILKRAFIILGPRGINNSDCFIRYRDAVSSLNLKYGNYTYRHTERDPIYKDLVMSTPCDAIRVGLLDLMHVWKKKNFSIVSRLTGDTDGFYIEIEYLFSRKTSKKELKNSL